MHNNSNYFYHSVFAVQNVQSILDYQEDIQELKRRSIAWQCKSPTLQEVLDDASDYLAENLLL